MRWLLLLSVSCGSLFLPWSASALPPSLADESAIVEERPWPVPQPLASERAEADWDRLDPDEPLPLPPSRALIPGGFSRVGHQKGCLRDDLRPNVADKVLNFSRNPHQAFSDSDIDVFSRSAALASMVADTQVYDASAVQDQLARRYAPKRWDVIEALPPVENQRNQGSCVGFATAYYGLQTLIKWRDITELRDKLKARGPEEQIAAVRARIKAVNKRFSPAFVYNQINRGEDRGSSIGDAFRLLAASGCAQWDDMPYDDRDYRTKPNDTIKGKATAWKGHIKRIWYIPRHCRLRVLQVFLSRGRPVIISMYVHRDFENFKAPSRDQAVYSPPANQVVDFQNKEGWHALCLFGFNNERAGGCFILVNSWGQNWGYRGVAYLRYADFWNYVSHAYSVE